MVHSPNGIFAKWHIRQMAHTPLKHVIVGGLKMPKMRLLLSVGPNVYLPPFCPKKINDFWITNHKEEKAIMLALIKYN
jgi:hypothetical protein